MEELRVRAGNEELKVKGSPETIQREREAFYQHIKEIEEANIKAKAELVQRMKNEMAWYARVRQEKDTANTEKPGVVRICGELKGTWEEIASAIKSGAEFKVGDYKKGSTVDGQGFTLVVTDVTDEYVRFESRDCLGGTVHWNEKGTTDGRIEEFNVQEWLMLELLGKLPDDLLQVIDKATRKYEDNEGKVKEYETLLFLPSASEVFDEDGCYGDEGLYEQMEYYKDRRNRMRGSAEGEDTCHWWLASVRSGRTTHACGVNSDGHASAWYADNTLHVPVCFIIKKS